MTKIIDGKLIANEIKADVKKRVLEMQKNRKKTPCLACIIVEGNKASEVYVASKVKASKECGIASRIVRLEGTISNEKLLAEIDKLNKDKGVSAILLQLPLPKHLDERKAINRILPEKDVDCLTNENLGALFSGNYKVAPCTATAVMRILEKENIDVCSKRVVVIGRSLLVGKSVAMLLLKANATITICHTKTKDLEKVAREADILVVATGQAHMVNSDFVKKGAVVIDVGITRGENGLKGDVDFESVKDKCSALTPVPGGVGPMTVACLMENTIKLCEE